MSKNKNSLGMGSRYCLAVMVSAGYCTHFSLDCASLSSIMLDCVQHALSPEIINSTDQVEYPKIPNRPSTLKLLETLL